MHSSSAVRMAVGCLVELAFKVAAGELKVSVWGGCLSTAWLRAEDGAALAFPSVRHGPFNLSSFRCQSREGVRVPGPTWGSRVKRD